MKKIRATIVALLLAISAIGFTVAQNVTPASAVLTNCSKGGQYYKGSQTNPANYAGIICFANGAGGGSVRLVVTCKYADFLINRTYTAYGNWAGVGSWSWVACGDHPDSYNIPDYIIHACPQMSVGSSAWGADFCF